MIKLWELRLLRRFVLSMILCNTDLGYNATISVTTDDPNDSNPGSTVMTGGLKTVEIMNTTSSSVSVVHKVNAAWSAGPASTITSGVSDEYTVAPSVPAKLGYSTPPSATGSTGVAFGQQPVVQVQDNLGNLISSATNSIRLYAYQEATCTNLVSTGSLLATSNPVSATAGVAAFAGVRFTASADIYLGAVTAGLQPACFGPINIAPPTATQLIVVLPGQRHNPGLGTVLKTL